MERAGYPERGNIQPFLVLFGCTMAALLTDSEYLGATGRADALGCRAAVAGTLVPAGRAPIRTVYRTGLAATGTAEPSRRATQGWQATYEGGLSIYAISSVEIGTGQRSLCYNACGVARFSWLTSPSISHII